MNRKTRLRLVLLVLAVAVAAAVGIDLAGRRLSYTGSTSTESTERVQVKPAAERGAAPALEFADEAGKPLTLADFRGRVVLVNLWATWCPPCVAEMPDLDRLQAELGGDRFLVLALSVDRGGAPIARRWLDREKLTHLAVHTIPSEKSGTPVLPMSMLVDRQGRLAWKGVGAFDWADPAVRAELNQLIVEEP